MAPSTEALLAPAPMPGARVRACTEPRAMYLRAGAGEPFFAFLHMGAAPRRQTAVLLCPPFGWEDMCSYRARREWAEHLARAGHTTLRIDLPGSGDSAGAATDPGRLDAWTRAVDGAARWLRGSIDEHSDGDGDGDDAGPVAAGRVAAIGLGLGGIVSCRAALQGAPIDELVLWAVPARGRKLVRELRTFSSFEVANVPDDGAPAPSGGTVQEVDDGTLVANGYLLSAETVEALERLDLQEIELSQPQTQVRRALLLGRDGLKVDKALPAVLERAGVDVSVADGPGYGAMMVEPQDARAPGEVFELVSTWLEEGEPERVAGSWADPVVLDDLHADPAVSGAPRVDPADRSVSGEPNEPSEHDEIVLDYAGVALRERPVSIDSPDGRLFGVLTEPLGARRELTALLLNAGPQRRTGPNRMWVEIARRWAARGVSTLRLDLAGIGDSDGDAAALARVTEFYKEGYVEQARAALESLSERGLPERFVVLGLCAGCYWAAHAALADERVASVIMLNPRTLAFDEWRHALRRTRHLRERMLRPSTWRKVLSGDIKLAKHLETGRTLIGRAASTPRRARKLDASADKQGATTSGQIEDLLDSLRDRDQRALLLFTGEEVLHRELSRDGVFDRLDRWPNLELARLGTSADTHTLTPLWLQRQVHALVDRVLADELERLS
jgi:alpha-beta hydrolase superfamily lysophospholipase